MPIKGWATGKGKAVGFYHEGEITDPGRKLFNKEAQNGWSMWIVCFLGGDWHFISKIYQVPIKRNKQYMWL